MKGVILRDVFVGGDGFSNELNRVPVLRFFERVQGTVIEAPRVDFAVEGGRLAVACGLVAVTRRARSLLLRVGDGFQFLPCLGGRGAKLG